MRVGSGCLQLYQFPHAGHVTVVDDTRVSVHSHLERLPDELRLRN